ncbi:Hsp20/alpha crystallin family protein [bacterium]|nr:Hsp20/alpha crystallin family protein [bacterium]
MKTKVFFNDFNSIESELYRLYSQFSQARYSSLLSRLNIWHPPIDVYEMEKVMVIKMEIAGLKDEDLSIQANGKYLTIQGIREEHIPPACPTYHNMELNFGPFERNILLPDRFCENEIKATYKNGFLLITISITESKSEALTIDID